MFFITSETNNQLINTDFGINQLNNSFPLLNSLSEIGTYFNNKLDQILISVDTQINDFLQFSDWEAKTRLAITGDWSATEAKDFFSNIALSQSSVEILPTNHMPGLAGGYDAITGKIYLSEDLIKYSDVAKIATVLVEEIGHKADDILNPGQDSPGDEGEILAKLINDPGRIPADWQELKQENDHKFIWLDNVWISIEASETIQQEWVEQLGTEFEDNAKGIAVDSQGNIYLTGQTFGNLGGVLGNDGDAWVAKYNPQGEQLWLQQFGSYSLDCAYDIVIDQQDNIYLTGIQSTNNIWVAKYNTEGQQLWFQQFVSETVNVPNNIAVDQQNNIYLTGANKHSLYSPYGSTYYDIPMIAKYNSQGQQLWLQEFGDKYNQDHLNSIVVDPQGNIYLTGYTKGFLGFNSYSDVFITKYNSQGQYLWNQKITSTSEDQVSSMKLDPQGNIYLTGYTEGNLDGINAGNKDAWFAKYSPQGQKQWLKQFGTKDLDQSNGISLDQAGNIYLTGLTHGNLGDQLGNDGDIWVGKYSPQGEQISVIQFGSYALDSGKDIILDQAGNIYFTGDTQGFVGNVYFGNNDAWIAKFSVQQIIPNIAIQDVAIVEGNAGQKNATFNITLDQITDQTVTVKYTTVNDTAIAGSDFVTQTNQIVFAPGVQSQTISVPIIGDTVVEPNETFFVQLSEPSNGVIATAKATGTITNDDQEIIVLPNIEIQDVAIIEDNAGQKNATFNVTLDKITDKTVTVKYTTVNDTVIAGSDFVTQTNQIVFAPGVNTQTISVPIIGDTVVESNETFFVQLSEPTNAVINTAKATGTITNDDQEIIVLPNLSIHNVNITEGNFGQKNSSFIVTLDEVSERTVTVKYSTIELTAKAGQDFVENTGQLIFDPGVKSQTVTVPIIGDKVFENNEKFIVKLSEPENAEIIEIHGVGTIINDDIKVLPNISIQNISLKEGNSGQKNAKFKLTLDKVSNQTITVEYTTVDNTAKAGQDFVKKTGKITFQPGIKSKTITIPIIGDVVLEPQEKFSVKLSKPKNAKIAKIQGIGTIINDDIQ